MRRFLGIAALAALAGMAPVAYKQEGVVATTPADIVWTGPAGAQDGRVRAVMHGDPDAGSEFWTYRVRTPAPIRVEAHVHTVDEYVTVLEGTWLLGEGDRFDARRLRAFPPGSFVRIPAGAAHFVATGAGVTVIQSSGAGRFQTSFITRR